VRALSLTAPALTAALAIYRQRCNELHIECQLQESAFAEALDLALLLSQRVVEGRKLRLTLLVQAEDMDLARNVQKDRSCGVVHIQLPDSKGPELVFSALEPYLGCASDQSSLCAVQRLEGCPTLRLGLLYFGTDLSSLSRRPCEPGSLLALVQRSLTIRIEYGTVSVGVGMDWFLTLQQGELLEIPRFEREIDAILAASGAFRSRLDRFLADTDRQGDSWQTARDQEPATALAPVLEGSIRKTIGDALREIIATIAHAQHGSTLLFGTESMVGDTMHYQPGALNLDLPLGEAVLRQFEAPRVQAGGGEDDREQGQCDKLAAERTAAIVRAIINLSQTDGAVVFDGGLTAIGSSTFLKVKESAAVAGGARRKSAQSFVRAHPGVVAVVISQDGFVSLCP
jgi:hypothetical protein